MEGVNDATLLRDLTVATPEILLALGGMAMLMIGVFRANAAPGGRHGATKAALALARRGAWGLCHYACIALLIVAAILVAYQSGLSTAFGGVFVDDAFARFVKILILLSSALMLSLGSDYLRRHEMTQFEYPVLFVFAALGMCMMVSARDLMALYMGLELQSLSLYVIASFQRDSVRSTEAGLKYFVLGALGSGLLLYGASLTYGFAGSTKFTAIAQALDAGDGSGGVSLGVLFGLAFMMAGLAFKISAAPFHMWTPDVYEGAPAPVTAFFATAPKVAAAALVARVLCEPFGGLLEDWRQIVAFLALASMFLGAFAGIGQTNIKRLMAYSSIGHMGVALTALTAGGADGVEAMLVYVTIYLLTNIGVFAFILTMTKGQSQTSKLADLDGLSKTHPISAASIAVLMFSLAGVPPLWGFFAKLTAFQAAIQADMTWLAVGGVIASVISAFYYLNIVRRIYFADAREPLTLCGGLGHRIALGGTALIIIFAVAPVINGFGALEAAAVAAESLAGLVP